MTKQKFYTSIPLAIAFLVLLAAGCNSNGNTLDRPSISENSVEENGKVAGSETVELSKKYIQVKNLNLNVEIANTDAARAQGLSNRKVLNEGDGMLFDFTNTLTKQPGFWMKDMLFSIDMIWINGNKIIAVNENAPTPTPGKTLEVYYPPSDISHVLEVPAGWSQRSGIKIGDEVKL